MVPEPGALGYRAMPIGMTTTEKDTAVQHQFVGNFSVELEILKGKDIKEIG